MGKDDFRRIPNGVNGKIFFVLRKDTYFLQYWKLRNFRKSTIVNVPKIVSYGPCRYMVIDY